MHLCVACAFTSPSNTMERELIRIDWRIKINKTETLGRDEGRLRR